MANKCVCIFHVIINILIPFISGEKKDDSIGAWVKYFDINMACMEAVVSQINRYLAQFYMWWKYIQELKSTVQYVYV